MTTTSKTSVEIPVWWKSPNGGLIRRESLEPDHPGSIYNYLLEQGLDPLEYGISPFVAPCDKQDSELYNLQNAFMAGHKAKNKDVAQAWAEYREREDL